jgi:hypothetical protein
VTTWNKLLLNQLKAKAVILGINDIKFVLDGDLHTYLDGSYLILIDEYPWMIEETPFSFNHMQRLPPVFLAGLKGKMIFFSGHFSKNFDDFCHSHFESFTWHNHKTICKVASQSDNFDFDLKCFPTVDLLKHAAIDFVMKTAKDKPVIVFGLNDLDGRVVELPPNVDYHLIQDET